MLPSSKQHTKLPSKRDLVPKQFLSVMSSPRLVLPATPEAVSCMRNVGTLEPSQVFRLQTAMANPIKLRSGTFLASSWPTVEARPLTLAWEIADLCEKRGIAVKDVRLEGHIVAYCMDPAKDCKLLEVVFRLTTTSRDALVATREVVLDALRKYLPSRWATQDAHMVAAAYMQSMQITPPDNTDDIHATFLVPGTAGSPSMQCKFVQRAQPPPTLDEYGVQILLTRDQLTTFLQAHANGSRLRPPCTPTPTVRFECLVGTPEQALEVLTPSRRVATNKKNKRAPLQPISQPSWNTPIKHQPTATELPLPTTMKGKAEAYSSAATNQCFDFVTCSCWKSSSTDQSSRRGTSSSFASSATTPSSSSSSIQSPASSSLSSSTRTSASETPSSVHIDQVVVCDVDRLTRAPLYTMQAQVVPPPLPGDAQGKRASLVHMPRLPPQRHPLSYTATNNTRRATNPRPPPVRL
ncbi:hypothetical protein PTSG_03678, partial [Salpingoeca rosetta]